MESDEITRQIYNKEKCSILMFLLCREKERL